MKNILKDLGLNNLKDYLYFVIYIFIIVISAFNAAAKMVALYAIIPMLFFHALTKQEFKVVIHKKYVFVFLSFFTYLFLTGIFAPDKIVYLDSAKRYLGVVIAIIATLVLIEEDDRRVSYISFVFILKFIYVYFYAKTNGLYEFSIESERIDIEQINGNMFGYYLFFSLISCYYLLIKSENKYLRILLITTLLFLVYSGFNLVLHAASRAGFLFLGLSLFIGILCIFYPFNKFKLIMIASIILIIVTFIIPIYIEGISDTLLFQRLDRNYAEDERAALLYEAFTLFKESPILGNGLGQFKVMGSAAFSHSSFTEALFEGGIIGFFLFMYVMLEPLMFYTRMRTLSKATSLRCDKLILFLGFSSYILYLLYNLFYVFYVSVEMFLFFFIIRNFVSEKMLKIRIEFF